MAVIYSTNINDILHTEKENRLRELLPAQRLKEIEQYHFREDYLRSLIGEGIVRLKASAIAEIDPKKLVIGKNSYGKPYFINVPDIHFNISHSGEWVMCILSNSPCGIDIEKFGEAHLDIAQHFFTTEEYKMILEKEPKHQTTLFYELWTLKESYIKFIGKGLAMPMNSFSFEKINGDWKINANGNEKCHFIRIPTEKYYIAYACVIEKSIRYMRSK